jgi:2-polyprenyl-6-methoxyphenol hydroxylase-like FAD-dependent oxidoreductase
LRSKDNFALFVAVFRTYPKRSSARRAAGFSLGFVLSEALVGAGLVLFELVAHDAAAAALGAYEARRRPRVDALQRGARRFGKLAQTSSRVGAWARDLAVRWTPASTTARALETILAHVA